MKDATLDQTFKTYIDGVSLPEVDLTAAKAEVKKHSQRRRGGKIAAAVLTAVASVVLIVAVAMQMTPWDMGGNGAAQSPAAPASYSLSETVEAETSYTALSASYRHALTPYEKFALASNADAQFTSYTLGGDIVLVRIDLAYVGEVQLRGTVYLDLTGGAKQAEELAAFRELADSRYGYRYETVCDNAEYYSKAYLERYVPTYVDLASNSADGLGLFLSLL